MAAVADRLGAAVASTIRVAHLAMAAEAMWKSATEGGGVTLGWKTAQGGPYEAVAVTSRFAPNHPYATAGAAGR